MRHYVFVKESIFSVSTEDLSCGRSPSGTVHSDLQRHWQKVRVVCETSQDLYVLKRDAGLSCNSADEQLRLDRKALEEAGEYHDQGTEMDFYLWPRRFS